MAAPGSSPIAIAFEGISSTDAIPTPVLLAGMLRASEKVSDLIFSPGRPPQVEIHGQLTAVEIPGSKVLSADDTRRIAADLIGNNKQSINTLREQGSCDVSYGLPGMARFRVNVFIQRGSCAIVMRVIPTVIPTFQFAAPASPTRRSSESSERHHPRHRRNGRGQVFHARRLDRPHQ
jgi:hypothetical protein